LSSVSGGESFLPHETDDLNAICRHIAKDIRSRYTITYVPSDSNGKPLRTISVTATSATGKKLSVRARTSYKFPKPLQEN